MSSIKSLPSLSAVIQPESLSSGGAVWVAHCPELDVTTQGDSSEHALEMLREAVELLLETADQNEIERRLQQGATVLPLQLDLAA